MQDIIAKLTAKDDKYACAIADKIISESQDTDEWYEYFGTGFVKDGLLIQNQPPACNYGWLILNPL